jgi:hypothetical protein
MGVSIRLVPAFPWVRFLSELLVRAFCWCQDCSDTSIALIPALLWCQRWRLAALLMRMRTPGDVREPTYGSADACTDALPSNSSCRSPRATGRNPSADSSAG